MEQEQLSRSEFFQIFQEVKELYKDTDRKFKDSECHVTA